jgi:mRNA-degrading endonuclease toxin of MazEF toxin-antitoxin module
MVDKIVTVPRARVGAELGHCSSVELDAIDDGLRRWLGMD